LNVEVALIFSLRNINCASEQGLEMLYSVYGHAEVLQRFKKFWKSCLKESKIKFVKG